MLGKLYVASEKDRREAQTRERRKQIEQERKDRIFNVKFRKIGVDISSLERQIEENKLKRENEKRIDKAFTMQFDRSCYLAHQLAEKEKEEKRRINEEINEYRRTFQRKEDRREYDLNDPQGLRKQLPPRCDGSAEISLASAQKFEGEDINSVERAKVMAAQRLAWLQQQIKERKTCEEEQKAAEEAYRKATTARDQRALQLESIERECRHRLDAATARFNRALADERKQRETIEQQNELQDNKAEIYNNLTSGMLAETHEASISALGPQRTIGSMYKGMTQADKDRIRKTQMEQIIQNKAKREAEQQLLSHWEDLSNSILKNVYMKDCEERRLMKEKAQQIVKENMELSIEQKKNKQHFDRVVNTNQPTNEFYRQFNASTR